jgi:SAM-dependent methyltransferase
MLRSTPPADVWAEGDAYEPFIGRWSRLVAATFVDWLAIPAGRRWLDVGCGTGALTARVLTRAQPLSVIGLDASASFIAYAQRQCNDPRVSFHVGDALALPFAAGTFEVVVSGLVLNHVADPVGMVRELARVTSAGGTVATYVWDYAGEMQQLRAFWDAAVQLDPQAADLDQGRRYPVCQPQPLQGLFARSRLAQVAVTAIDVPTIFPDFASYWTPFLGGQGPAPGYLKTLTEDQRNQLRERLRRQLPIAPDGSIHLRARAWAVRGTRRPLR